MAVASKAMFPERRFIRAVFVGELPQSWLGAPFAPDPDFVLDQLRQQINTALDTVSYRERAILEMRFGLGDGHAYTLAETGYVFKLTRERIRQIQNKALRKLRLRADELRHFLAETDS